MVVPLGSASPARHRSPAVPLLLRQLELRPTDQSFQIRRHDYPLSRALPGAPRPLPPGRSSMKQRLLSCSLNPSRGRQISPEPLQGQKRREPGGLLLVLRLVNARPWPCKSADRFDRDDAAGSSIQIHVHRSLHALSEAVRLALWNALEHLLLQSTLEARDCSGL